MTVFTSKSKHIPLFTLSYVLIIDSKHKMFDIYNLERLKLFFQTAGRKNVF